MKGKNLRCWIMLMAFSLSVPMIAQKKELVEKFVQAEKRSINVDVPRTRSVQGSEDFITKHAHDKHVYNANKVSTPNRTQYGNDVNVQAVRRQTLQSPDKITFLPHQTPNQNGVRLSGSDGAIYSKRYNGNLSTPETPSTNSRVIINNNDKKLSNPQLDGRSTQYPTQKPTFSKRN